MLDRLGRALAARTLAPAVDTALKKFALSRSAASRKKSSAESLGPAERAEALAAIAALYDRADHFARPATFFGERVSIAPKIAKVSSTSRTRIVDLRWESARPTFVADLDERYRAPKENRTAHARRFSGGAGRPTVVLIHGYLGGVHAIEGWAWPVRAFVERGLDVALFVLPFHGPRGSGRRPLFPGSDPRFTIEGFRQAIFDLDALVGWLRGDGVPHVGVMGMSLGGYTTALAATTIADLDFAVPMIPLASIADFARDDDRFVGTEAEREQQYRLLEDAHRVVSPLARRARIARERMLVLGSERDRITPIRHAERLSAHLGAELIRMQGGHLVQVDRDVGFRAMLKMLGREGILRRG